MEDLYEDAPKHPEAYRVAGLRGFNEHMAQRKNRDGQAIDLIRSMSIKWSKNG